MPVRRMFQYAEPQRRSPVAVLISLVLHSAAAAGAIWLASVQVARPPLPREQLLPFLRVMLPTAPVDAIEALRVTPPRETPPPAPPPEPDLIVELPTLPEPVTPAPRRPTPAAPEPVPAPTLVERPAVRVGDFAAATVSTSEAERRQVRAVGFEAQRAIAPDIGTRVTSVGVFGSDGANARPGSDRSTAGVVASGFESGQALSAPTRTARTVASSGFGSTAASSPAPVARETVKTAGFSDAQPAPAATARQRTAPVVTPVEVLFKPTPAYSAEARALKIQGEVTLEVRFSAAGQVRVLRVVRGLGHGLDELAISAAEQIRFKPAQSDGRPVDFTANVEIVFRLT